MPAEWASLYGRLAKATLVSDGTVYLHERSAGGERRLVAIDAVFATPASGATRVVLVPRVLRLGTPIRPAAVLQTLDRDERPSLPAVSELKIFAGTSSPTDPGAFSIRYEVGDDEGTIEGRLLEGDIVELRRVPATR